MRGALIYSAIVLSLDGVVRFRTLNAHRRQASLCSISCKLWLDRATDIMGRAHIDASAVVFTHLKGHVLLAVSTLHASRRQRSTGLRYCACTSVTPHITNLIILAAGILYKVLPQYSRSGPRLMLNQISTLGLPVSTCVGRPFDL